MLGYLKECLQVREIVLLVSNVLNVLRGSFNLVDEIQESQEIKVQEALDMGEVKRGKGLNQELDLLELPIVSRVWHYKSFRNSLVCLALLLCSWYYCCWFWIRWRKAKTTIYFKVFQIFEIVFIVHLMRGV